MPPIVPRSGVIRRTRPMLFGDSRLLIKRWSLIDIWLIYKPPLEGVPYTFGSFVGVVVADGEVDLIDDLVTMGGVYECILIGGLPIGCIICSPRWGGGSATSTQQKGEDDKREAV